MDKTGLRLFLSERAIGLHKEYIERCRLKLSILGKSGYKVEQSYPELRRERLGDARTEILTLSREIYLHEIYFDSFAEGSSARPIFKSRFGSLAGFLYRLEREAMASEGGFLLVSRLGEEIMISHSSGIGDRFRGTPILALDLYEHAYFLDYGFEKQAYIRGALSRLNTAKL